MRLHINFYAIPLQFSRQIAKFKPLANVTHSRYGTNRIPAVLET